MTAITHDEMKELAEARREVELMKEHTWCAYCGHEIHIDDEAATKISEHIMACERHPIHIALADNAALRKRCEEAEKVIKAHVLQCRGWLGDGAEWEKYVDSLYALKEAK